MIPPGRDSQQDAADRLVNLGVDRVDSFFARVRRRLDESKIRLPQVEIVYRNISYTTEASSTSAAIPGLTSVLIRCLKPRQRAEQLTILNDISGRIRPGRFTLLLGPPSCGKSTFLRMLAGRVPKNFSGKITWNGHEAHEFCAPRTAAFVAQVDTHIPNLTTRETADFSYTLQHNEHGSDFKAGAALRKSNGGSSPESSKMDIKGNGKQPAQLESIKVLPDHSELPLTDEQIDELAALMLDGPGRPDLFLHMFGLANCADTVVGNAMLRGISGGERKRLSTVEMLMSQQRVTILDEISTGLDSATLFNIIRWLRAINHSLLTTTVISLLQPPPETFALFDDVMVMSEGKIVYHGPVPQAVPFFESLGFQLPPRKDVPSYLQELMTVPGQVMYSSPELKASKRLAPDVDPTDEEAMADMDLLISLDAMTAASRKFEKSEAFAHSEADSVPRSMEGLVPVHEKFAVSPLPALQHVLERQGKLFRRDKSLTKARLGQCTLMGLIIGSLFYNLDVSVPDGRTFLGAIFMAVMFMAFGGMPQMSIVLQNRTVWFKQRACNMYSASAYAWSMSLVQVPMSCLEALIFSLFLYFMIGFTTDGAGYFFIFYVILALSSMCLTSLFRLVGCLFQDLAIANSVAGFTLLMLIINSGFVIIHKQIPPWTIFAYWISPFAYAVRALAINEFTSPRWQHKLMPNGGTMGDLILHQFDFYNERMWIWIAMGYLVFTYILCTQLAALGLALLQPPRQQAVVRSKEEIKADRIAAREAKKAAEQFVAKQSARVTRPSVDVDDVKAIDGLEEGGVPSARRTTSADSGRGLAVARTLAFTPISVVWRHLHYYVAVPKGLTGPAAANIMPDDHPDEAIAKKKRLLNDITGYARPGVLTALMGGSGAGKTTLMDVLAGRKTQGVITGDLLINGHPKEQATWSRVVGYVEQTDVHSAGLTVEESLNFSAGLRLTGDVSKEQRVAYVQEVLTVTELLNIRGNMVGVPGGSGLSVEQRRRLSIGVELVANPSVVFMDEPTSGLDARSAAAVMAAVKNVAGNGRTVMVTIHQPSIEIFEAFDALVLLAMGGSLIFFGSLGTQSSRLVRYFEAVPGVPKLKPDYNPATWMLEVCGGAAKMYVDSVDADFQQLYLQSDLAKRAAETADIIVESDKKTHEPLTMATRYATSRGNQLKQLIWKQSLLYWRNPGYSLGRLGSSLLTALVFGLIFWQEGDLPSRPGSITIGNVQSILGSMYAGLSFMGMTNLIMGVPAFYAERQVSYRERASSMYAVFPLAAATGLVELPYLLVQALIFSPVAYFMIGFKATAGAIIIYFIIFAESISLYTFMGQLFTYLTPTPVLATLLGGLNHFLWNIFNGFLVPNPQMPKGWIWMNYISATTWVIYGLGVSQLGDVEDKIVIPGNPDYPGCGEANLAACPSVSQFVEDYFGFKYEFRWWCALILLAFIVVFRVSAMIVLKLINHQHR